jgi:hypothetical protein
MFEVKITTEAKEIIGRAIADHVGPKAGLMIHRQGPTGDNSRDANGNAAWSIERRHPWAIQVGSYETIPDDSENIVFVDGVRVWLPLIPRKGELGVTVTVLEGQLHVEAIDV